MSKDNLGDRMKQYEAMETERRFLKYLPVYARLDGRCFSKFTKGFNRPFDRDMSIAMIETTKHMVEQFNCKIGYTQSDEISLVMYSNVPRHEPIFDNKIQKIVSNMAATASVFFANEIHNRKSSTVDTLPTFDCRVIQFPTLVEASNMFLWREADAKRNSVSMAARSHFSHKELQGLSRDAMIKKLADIGIDYDLYPISFKRGVYVRSENYDKNGATRSKTSVVIMPEFNTVENRTDVIFKGADPIVL